jgi:uncharacterized protein YjlB
MQRKKFLSFMGLSFLSATIPATMQAQSLKSEEILFKDDGKIPNSKFPLLVYRNVFSARGMEGATWLEQKFGANNWTNSWRNGVYPFHHYHSTSHEVLGVYSGSALLHLGGEQGQKVTVRPGDVLIIPAGVGHKNLESEGLGVVGAYPDGRSWDINKGLPGERPQTDHNIAALPIPGTDPLWGREKGLTTIWR